MKIVVIGGGNIGTLMSAELLHNNPNLEIYLHTRDVTRWSDVIEVTDTNGDKLYAVDGVKITDKIISDADLYFFTIPKHVIKNELEKYLCTVRKKSIFTFIPGTGGVERLYNSRCNKEIDFVGLQRVPYISRINKYGKSVALLSKRERLYASSMSGIKYDFLKDLLKIETEYLPNYLCIAFTPSNPILHTSRLYSLFSNSPTNEIVKKKTLFYRDWDDNSSSILLNADSELQEICRAYKKINLAGVKSLREHYESSTPNELTKKITSIESLKSMGVPIVRVDDTQYEINLNDRYFLEDFKYGLVIIKAFAEIANVKTPTINKMLKWYGGLSDVKILDDNEKLIISEEMLVPQNYGIQTIKDVEKFYVR